MGLLKHDETDPQYAADYVYLVSFEPNPTNRRHSRFKMGP